MGVSAPIFTAHNIYYKVVINDIVSVIMNEKNETIYTNWTANNR